MKSLFSSTLASPRRSASQSRLPGLLNAGGVSSGMASSGSVLGKLPFGLGSEGNRRWLYALVAGLCVLLFLMVPRVMSVSSLQSGLRETFPSRFRIAVIADLDKRSKQTDAKGKEAWHSIYMTATLTRKGEEYEIDWDAPADVSTGHNEAGRGCELSELVRYNGGLYAFDDRTGIMFEIANPEDSSKRGEQAPFLIPRHLFMEGDGHTDKGLKIEWASVKDGLLYVGSFGKEFTDNNGAIVHANNLWVVVVDKEGHVTHVNWQDYYNAMRRTLGYEHPGYLLHEAITWSPHHKQWFVFPRRMSREPYDDVSDERRGANSIIIAGPDFKTVQETRVGTLTPERGFSTAKFLPGSRDTVIVAVKSAENAEKDMQTAFITIYGEVTPGVWKVLMEETEIPGDSKFEGFEVISWGEGSD